MPFHIICIHIKWFRVVCTSLKFLVKNIIKTLVKVFSRCTQIKFKKVISFNKKWGVSFWHLYKKSITLFISPF